MKGKRPSERAADALEGLRALVEGVLEQRQQRARDGEQQRDRPGVAPQLGEHPTRGGDRRCAGSRRLAAPRSARGTRPRGRAHPCAGAGRRASRRPARRRRASARALAVVGLVHDVAGDEQRRPVGGQALERCSTARCAGRGSSPTVGSSRTSSPGSASSAVASDTRALPPPDRMATTWSACSREADGRDRLLDPRLGRPEHAGEVARFSRAVRSP